MAREEEMKSPEADGLIAGALDLAVAFLRGPTREQLDKMFPGCDSCKPRCGSCERMYAWDKHGKPQECTGCAEHGYPHYVPEEKFCECCGKPLTDEAVALMSERWKQAVSG